MLRSMGGITYAEAHAERDGDAYTYMIETEYGTDIRKKLFYQLAERNWPMVGMEALGMSLEDIFISVVDSSNADKGSGRVREARSRRTRSATQERSIGAALYEDARKQRSEAPAAEDDDE